VNDGQEVAIGAQTKVPDIGAIDQNASLRWDRENAPPDSAPFVFPAPVRPTRATTESPHGYVKSRTTADPRGYSNVDILNRISCTTGGAS